MASADPAAGISRETKALFASHPGTCFFRNVILPRRWVPHLAAREGLLGCFRWGGTVMCVALVAHDSTPQNHGVWASLWMLLLQPRRAQV